MVHNLNILLLAQPNGGNAGSPLFSFVLMGGIILIFWFFMIRPQAKKAKEQKKFIENLQKGEKIVTISGMHGIIHKINEDGTLQLEVSPGMYIKIEKAAISQEWSKALQQPQSAAK